MRLLREHDVGLRQRPGLERVDGRGELVARHPHPDHRQVLARRPRRRELDAVKIGRAGRLEAIGGHDEVLGREVEVAPLRLEHRQEREARIRQGVAPLHVLHADEPRQDGGRHRVVAQMLRHRFEGERELGGELVGRSLLAARGDRLAPIRDVPFGVVLLFGSRHARVHRRRVRHAVAVGERLVLRRILRGDRDARIVEIERHPFVPRADVSGRLDAIPLAATRLRVAPFVRIRVTFDDLTRAHVAERARVEVGVLVDLRRELRRRELRQGRGRVV